MSETRLWATTIGDPPDSAVSVLADEEGAVMRRGLQQMLEVGKNLSGFTCRRTAYAFPGVRIDRGEARHEEKVTPTVRSHSPRPSDHPRLARPARNAARRDFVSGSSAAYATNIATRLIPLGCCARAAIGQA